MVGSLGCDHFQTGHAEGIHIHHLVVAFVVQFWSHELGSAQTSHSEGGYLELIRAECSLVVMLCGSSSDMK